jgi:hypothetical protein
MHIQSRMVSFERGLIVLEFDITATFEVWQINEYDRLNVRENRSLPIAGKILLEFAFT